jgi:Gdp/GTP exchange factor required for growth at low temperatures
MQMFLHPSTFMSGGGSSSSSHDAGLSPASTALSPTFTAPLQRKLRRSRSIDISATPAAVLSPPPQPSEPPSSRTHSQSITSIDMPRLPSAMVDLPRPPVGDIFGDVMHWTYPSPTRSAAHRTQSIIVAREISPIGEAPTPTTARMPAIIVQPFGPGVLFDSPSRRSNRDSSLPAPHPHLLRQMHSFESGMTARQIGVDSGSPFLSPSPSPEPDAVLDISAAVRDSDQGGRTSAPQLDIGAAALDERDSSPSPPPEVKEEPKTPPYGPSPETSLHSRYSTDVFDVLQTYRGLPQLDKLFQDETTVIKMSLSADETAAPKDDPRFVIWGEIYAQTEGDEVLSVSHGSSSAHSSSNASKKRKGKVAPHVDIPSVRVTAGEGLQKVLVAATIERWIAQLTSELNYDELLNFFLTYRTYISAVDLCHLLICRFHWALSQPTSVQDEDVRKIVRVRTFVAIRYWLLTFFAVDFLGNRELRLLLASWINALVKDPVLKKHSDGLVCIF